jgi:ACS family hexuronate transporter-like MFS transporter
MATFTACAALAALSTIAAEMPRGPLLMALLLAIGFGALGVFPAYYSLSQELSLKHQGIITGVLSAATWVCTAVMQKLVGQEIDATNSYARAIFWLGLAPAFACAVLWPLWDLGRTTQARRASEEQ